MYSNIAILKTTHWNDNDVYTFIQFFVVVRISVVDHFGLDPYCGNTKIRLRFMNNIKLLNSFFNLELNIKNK